MNKKYGFQLVNFHQIFTMIDSEPDFLSKIVAMKMDYPSVFIDYCEHYNLRDELDEYV